MAGWRPKIARLRRLLGWHLFSMLNQMVRNILLYNHQHSDFPMTSEQMEQYVPKSLIYSLLWSFAGDAKMKVRHAMSDFVRSITTIPLPPVTTVPILDFEVRTLQTSFLSISYQSLTIHKICN